MDRVVGRGLAEGRGALVADRGDADHAAGEGVLDGGLELGRGARDAEAHVDDVGAVVGRPVDGLDDVGEAGAAVAVEGADRHDRGPRRHQADQPGHHGAVAEAGGQVLALDQGAVGLLDEDLGGGVLVDGRPGAFDEGAVGLVACRPQVELGLDGAGRVEGTPLRRDDVLLAEEDVVARHQGARQSDVAGVDAGVDDGYGAGAVACRVQGVPSRKELGRNRRRLLQEAAPDRGREVGGLGARVAAGNAERAEIALGGVQQTGGDLGQALEPHRLDLDHVRIGHEMEQGGLGKPAGRSLDHDQVQVTGRDVALLEQTMGVGNGQLEAARGPQDEAVLQIGRLAGVLAFGGQGGEAAQQQDGNGHCQLGDPLRAHQCVPLMCLGDGVVWCACLSRVINASS